MINRFDEEYRFLSNFYPVLLHYNGLWYPSVEHAYQAQKTTDEDKRKEIAALRSAGAAKKAGRDLKIRRDWHSFNLGIMYDLVKQKFEKDEALGRMLHATGDQALIEGNNWGDTFWGTYHGKGENHLGKILMEVREELREKYGSYRAVQTSTEENQNFPGNRRRD